ncbi:MAG: hypothetical protein KGI27_10100 [Thaumarchaeota archaeon]|nr:hypothetical protein [Nitrososphaerota archaeon]
MPEETALVQCISKRCQKCGVQPAPSDMQRLWGYQWKKETMCKNCREPGKKVLVIMVPKLKNRHDIKEWYIPIELRLYARKVYIDEPTSTRIYISDGDRFWNWSSFPHNLDYAISFDHFIKACPDWKIVSPYITEKAPKPSSYVAC